MSAQALRRSPSDGSQPAARPSSPAAAQDPSGPAPRSATTGEPSPAQILTEAFDDLRRRMVNIEGRLVSLGTAPEDGPEGLAIPHEPPSSPRSGAGRTMRAAGLAVIGALCFGAGALTAERVPEVGEMGRGAVLWAEEALRGGMASAAVLLDR